MTFIDKIMIEFENNHNTFFEEKDIHCNYLDCIAGAGMAGMGKCFNKGNGKPDCPQFQKESDVLKEWEAGNEKF